MLNSISIIPSSQDEVTSSADGMSWGATTSVNGTPARGNSPRTFLMKASRFFAELKRRKVYKVEVAYAFVSWLLIQAASIFLPTFGAPQCMMKAVVVFLALGFILSAILSWIFDITPQGISERRTFCRTKRLTSFGSLRHRPDRNSSAVIYLP